MGFYYLLFAICNLLLSPLWMTIFPNPVLVIAANYTILIFAGFILTGEHKKHRVGLIIGFVAVVMIWADGLTSSNIGWACARSLTSFVFIIFCA